MHCFLCKSKQDDPVKFGQFMTHNSISVHYYCLLLTTNLIQDGKDDEGILGFLEKDIRKTEKNIKSKRCYYCFRQSANVSCATTSCKKTFHLICGIEHHALNQFTGAFESFCAKHAQKVKCRGPPKDESCSVCLDKLGISHSRDIIRAPCCKSGWFHKSCLAHFALNAGYFFKCPLCNNNKLFREKLPLLGVFIPNQDAAWELEPNAFSELLERPNTCSAAICKERARLSTSSKDLIHCTTCGSQAIHRKCMTHSKNSFTCPECTSTLSTSRSDDGNCSLETASNSSSGYGGSTNSNSSDESSPVVGRIRTIRMVVNNDETKTEPKHDGIAKNLKLRARSKSVFYTREAQMDRMIESAERRQSSKIDVHTPIRHKPPVRESETEIRTMTPVPNGRRQSARLLSRPYVFTPSPELRRSTRPRHCSEFFDMSSPVPVKRARRNEPPSQCIFDDIQNFITPKYVAEKWLERSHNTNSTN